jgi:hypothetical protein
MTPAREPVWHCERLPVGMCVHPAVRCPTPLIGSIGIQEERTDALPEVRLVAVVAADERE